jgi:RES domain
MPAPAFKPQEYDARVWRVVEAQHKISTSRLVQSQADQALLETLVESAKPPVPKLCRYWHYLLQTPFRYGHKGASRFRAAYERPGIFYASEHVRSALAETGYWRLRFFAHLPPIDWPTGASLHHSFYVNLHASKAIDLTMPPYIADSARWRAADDYSACQQIATLARAANIACIRYTSVRDPQAGYNIALLSPEPLAGQQPTIDKTWLLQIEPGRVLAHADFPSHDRYEFRFNSQQHA